MDFGSLSDEEKMGIKYSQIAEMIEKGSTDDREAQKEIIRRFNASRHKRKKADVYMFDRKNYLLEYENT